MGLLAPTPLPQPNFPWTDLKTGQPTQAFAQYMASLDPLERSLLASVLTLQAQVLALQNAPPSTALLNTLTGSGGATLSDTTSFTAAYKNYYLVFDHLLPAVADSFKLLIHSGGSFKSSGYIGGGGGGNYIAIGGATSIAASGLNGRVDFFAPLDGTFSMVLGTVSTDNGGAIAVANPNGYWGTPAVVDGLQIATVGGANIASGKVLIYGYN